MKISCSPILKTIFALFLCAFIHSASAQAPDYGDTRVMFIKIADLNVDSYAALAKAIEGDDRFSIRHACVPAQMVMFDLAADAEGTLQENFQIVKLLTMQNTNLTELQIIAEYSEADFMARCQMFRTGNSVE
jgi:hypothetical protein